MKLLNDLKYLKVSKFGADPHQRLLIRSSEVHIHSFLLKQQLDHVSTSILTCSKEWGPPVPVGPVRKDVLQVQQPLNELSSALLGCMVDAFFFFRQEED